MVLPAAAFVVIYAVSLLSAVAIFATVFVRSRRASAGLGAGRLLELTREEARRSISGDPVFLMHASIALGVGVSIAEVVLAPVLPALFALRILLLAVSVPAAAGLVVAFAWRVQRFVQSKSVERSLHTTSAFSSASTRMQGILMVAIALTASELVVAWFPAFALVDAAVSIVRNSLVVAYYVGPTVNLISKVGMRLPSVETPFVLSDIMSGKVDASTVRSGVGDYPDFSPKESLSFDSCVEIGACEASCPATAAGRPLSPRVLMRKLSLHSDAGGEGGPFAVVGEDELWSCTSCGACVSSCPVGVKHLDIVYDLRRDLVARGKLDKEKAGMLENLARSQNPYGFKQSDRAKWAEGLGVQAASESSRAEYVYWVGCVASFDQRAQRVAKSMAKIMKSAGVSFAILGQDEACVGDPARRLGEEGRYQELVYQNVEKLNSLGAKKVVTTCPHCFNSLKNEYPRFGGEYEVVHHTQLISDLIRSGRLKVTSDRVKEVSVTLHDACYASRYNNIFDEPREALGSSVSDVREMKRNGEKTFCCGAGGSNYWFKVPEQRTISGIRAKEAAETGAKAVATECPFCLSMLDDSSKVMGTGMEVRDVAEIVADAVP